MEVDGVLSVFLGCMCLSFFVDSYDYDDNGCYGRTLLQSMMSSPFFV